MPGNEEADKPNEGPEEGMSVVHKRLRPRWQRWLLWSAVRLLLLAGVGAGVGTVQWRMRPLDLMAHAQKIASIANANGYYWTPKGELRLYRHGATGTASLRWNPTTQSATVVEMLKPRKGQRFAEPARDATPHVQMLRGQDRRSQVQIVEAYKKWQSFTPGKPLPEPDYLWKIRVQPNLIPSFLDLAVSPDGKRVAYKCLMPRVDWRDEFMLHMRRGYKPPFRGQGAAILISNVDGSRTEMLGRVKEDMPAPHSQYSRSGTTASLQSVFWCLDGKHLSFEYGDGVYEVPVK